MAQYVDQNLIKINEQKVLAIAREIINGTLKADKT
jgi:anti-sigma28 factor (negative regulator of flagellin synthesis)